MVSNINNHEDAFSYNSVKQNNEQRQPNVILSYWEFDQDTGYFTNQKKKKKSIADTKEE